MTGTGSEIGVPHQVESLVLARDSAAANHKRELAAAQRDAAQVEAQHKSAAATWHTDLDWHRSEVRYCHNPRSLGPCLLFRMPTAQNVWLTVAPALRTSSVACRHGDAACCECWTSNCPSERVLLCCS